MKLMLMPVSIFIVSLIAPLTPSFAGADPLVPSVPSAIAPRNHPFSVTLDGRRVISISGDSAVYSLGNDTIVITSTSDLFRTFLARIKEGRRDTKITVTLVPEQKSLFNARFQAFHMHHSEHSSL
jgi:hypothetical protein